MRVAAIACVLFGCQHVVAVAPQQVAQPPVPEPTIAAVESFVPYEACAATPRPAALPLENLSLARRLSRLPDSLRVEPMCDGLLVMGDGRASFHSISDPDPLALIAKDMGGAFVHVGAAGGAIMELAGDSLVLHDRRTGNAIWRARTGYVPAHRAEIAEVITTSDVVVTVVERADPDRGHATDWIASDLPTGVELWRGSDLRQDLRRGRVHVVAGKLLGNHAAGGMFAVDPRTGRVGWSDHLLRFESATADSFMAKRLEELHVYDGSSFADRGRVSLDPGRTILSATAVGSVAYVLSADVHDWGSWVEHAALDATDIASGRRLFHTAWQTGVSDFSHCYGTLLADDDALYVLDRDCVARGFDRASGTERWRWGAHSSGEMLLAGGRLVLVGGDVEIFERGERPVPIEHARVRGVARVGGRGLAGISVLVGGTATRTGPDGRFAVDVAARGRVVVQVGKPGASCGRRPATSPEIREVTLDGRSTDYTLTIDASIDPCE